MLEKKRRIFELIEEKLKGSLGFVIEKLDSIQKGNDAILNKMNFLERKMENLQREFNQSMRMHEKDFSRQNHPVTHHQPKPAAKTEEVKNPPVKDLFGNNVPANHESSPKPASYVKGTCKVWGCDNSADQSGYCSKHFHVYRKR